MSEHDLLADLLSEQEEERGPYHPLDPTHPLHQEVWDHPENYVVVSREVWNRICQMGLNIPIEEQTEEKWYPCRYPGCKQEYKNSASNRVRHERKSHNYFHKGDEHGEH